MFENISLSGRMHLNIRAITAARTKNSCIHVIITCHHVPDPKPPTLDYEQYPSILVINASFKDDGVNFGVLVLVVHN